MNKRRTKSHAPVPLNIEILTFILESESQVVEGSGLGEVGEDPAYISAQQQHLSSHLLFLLSMAFLLR